MPKYPKLEYRIMWEVGGVGGWTPIEWPFAHRQEAMSIAGIEYDGLAAIVVSHAFEVQFRWVR